MTPLPAQYTATRPRPPPEPEEEEIKEAPVKKETKPRHHKAGK